MQIHSLTNLIRCFTIIMVVSIFGLMAYSQEARQAVEKKPAVSLQVAAALAKPGPTLIFIATNNSDKELLMEEPGVGGSPIVITRPNGKVVTYVSYGIRIGPLPSIRPHETLTWSKDLYRIFNFNSLNETGIYQVSWQAATGEPNTSHNAVHKSNELLVMREKGTPAIDPTTGLHFDPETGKFINPTTGKPFPGQDK